MLIQSGSNHFDYLQGSFAADHIEAFEGNDIIRGEEGKDFLQGDQGKDKIIGNGGDDSLDGGEHEDLLRGGKGNDSLFGGSGNDFLYGEQGNDTLIGGMGDDVFAIGKGHGGFTKETADFITDFGQGSDSLRLLNGLQFSDLKIFLDPQSLRPQTVIQDSLTGEFLAILEEITPDQLSDKNVLSFQSGNLINRWNHLLLNAIKTEKTAPPVAARNMAMVHTAIYDTVNSITQTYQPYAVRISANPNTSLEAAISTAAHRVLVDLYPQEKAVFDTALATSLEKITENQARQEGIILGETVANQILDLRKNDGSNSIINYTPSHEIGHWQPTPPNYANSLLPQWPNVTPFAMTNPAQFQPPGPPNLESERYAFDVNLVQEIGGKSSTIRTQDQVDIANFWENGVGTFTPPGHWNQIAGEICTLMDSNLTTTSQLFALLNIALADAGIAAWECKYKYDFWRPITAIQQAANDQNPATIADKNWEPLLTTPPFSEYISGHSSFSGAADVVMSSFFGNDFGFANSGDSRVNQLRVYDNFSQAADESGMSRIYGGIHFMSANEDGLLLGRNIGNYVLQNLTGSVEI